ncbi:hypothetical protein H2248_011782 [Termitomyces sp. 'cryptogamus']|nr:hypothetical protein H2248_011782 [Termitomyces sp. 'cryptogamus']
MRHSMFPLLSLLFLISQWSTACASTLSSLRVRRRNPFPFDPGFPIDKVIVTALNISTYSWELGTATEALLELYSPELSVFGDSPFEAAKNLSTWSILPHALAYAAEKIVIGTGPNALSDGDGAVGDPASLGVGAVLLGKVEGYERFGAAAAAEYEFITQGAPRAWNGAISHRVEYVELWADFIYMAPPFLAYYAVETRNITLLREAVYQCQAYRQILQYNTTTADKNFEGLWEHILGPVKNDPGLWSTGNSWAAAGMARVLATVMKAPAFPSSDDTEAQEIAIWRKNAVKTLTDFIKEIVDGAIGAGPTAYDNKLTRNYYNNPDIFGETSGSSLMAATVYRLAVLVPDVFGNDKYIQWAEGIRTTFGGTFVNADGTILEHVDRDNGTVRPAVNPLAWTDTNPWMTGSPEGQSFVALLYASWRDCIYAAQCWNGLI